MSTPYTDYPKMRKIMELYKMIRSGTAEKREQLADILDVSPETIKKYIAELKNEWGAEIEYKGRRYVLVREGMLGSLTLTQPLSHFDVFILLTTMIEAYPFMETKFEIIKGALLSMIPYEEQEKYKSIFKNSRETLESNVGIENTIKIIMQGILSHQKIKITYKNGKGEVKNRVYRPYTLACDHGKYYLIAERDDKGYMHHLRTDQILRAEIIKERFAPVEDLDLARYLKKTWYMYTGEETHVKVKFTPGCKKVVLERNMSMGEIVEETPEYFIYDFICNGTKGIKLWLMGFMDEAEILEPKSLREEVKEKARKMAALYEGEKN